MRAVATLVLLCAASAPALADEPADGGVADPSEHPPIHNRFNIRVGMSSADTQLNEKGHPTICLDVNVAYGFGVETCGTGAQVLHNDPGEEMSHYRINYTLVERSLWKGTLHARGGLGFAEMQVGKDNPGFVFGSPDADGGSVSGPETVLSAQWILPAYRGLDFVITGTGGLAYFDHAAELSTAKSQLQSFASIEAGIGW